MEWPRANKQLIKKFNCLTQTCQTIKRIKKSDLIKNQLPAVGFPWTLLSSNHYLALSHSSCCLFLYAILNNSCHCLLYALLFVSSWERERERERERESLDGRGYKNIEGNKKWASWQLEELIGDTAGQFILLVSLYPTSC